MALSELQDGERRLGGDKVRKQWLIKGRVCGRRGKGGEIGRRLMRGGGEIGPPIKAVSLRTGKTPAGATFITILTDCLASHPRIEVVDNIFIVLVM
jgi:hypothetical protein